MYIYVSLYYIHMFVYTRVYIYICVYVYTIRVFAVAYCLSFVSCEFFSVSERRDRLVELIREERSGAVGVRSIRSYEWLGVRWIVRIQEGPIGNQYLSTRLPALLRAIAIGYI